jgi:hypothetical protein
VDKVDGSGMFLERPRRLLGGRGLLTAVCASDADLRQLCEAFRPIVSPCRENGIQIGGYLYLYL